MKRSKKVISIMLSLLFILSFAASAFAEIDEYHQVGSGSTGQTVRNLQKRLNELGYNAGSPDGVFASGTKKAVEAFQERNGLEITGIADPSTQELLFSSNAKKAFIHEVEITKVVWLGNRVSIEFKNNIGEQVDSVTYYVFTHDLRGNLYAAKTELPEAEMLGRYTSIFEPLPSGSTGTVECSLSPNVIDGKVLYVSVGIKSFHTTAGRDYEYSPEQLLFIRNDGNAIYPENSIGPSVMEDEDLRRAATIRFGYTYYDMPRWTAHLYGFLEGGEWVSSVEEGSAFADAGLKENDLILSFNGESALNAHADEVAKLHLLAGEAVSVRYLRNGEKLIAVLQNIAPVEESSVSDQPEADPDGQTELNAVTFAPDAAVVSAETALEAEAGETGTPESPAPIFLPSPKAQTDEAAPSGQTEGGSSVGIHTEGTLVEQLTQLAELYRAGLLTEEEFAAAKAILLGEK